MHQKYDIHQEDPRNVFHKLLTRDQLESTGTTIVGVQTNDFVIMAADSKATAGTVIAIKDTQKIHQLAPNIQAAGAGTAADNDQVTRQMENWLTRLRLKENAKFSRPLQLVSKYSDHLSKYGGQIGCYMIVGGVDPVTGPALYSMVASGHISHQPHLTLGSGSMDADTVMELGYKPDMDLEQALNLCAEAAYAGARHDTMSGFAINCAIVYKDCRSELRNGIRPAMNRIVNIRNNINVTLGYKVSETYTVKTRKDNDEMKD